MERHAAIYWKKNNAPGICIVGDEIREWPDALGPRPTEAEIQAWIGEYLIWKAAQDQAEADRIAAKAQAIIDNLPTWQEIDDAITAATTIAGLKVIIRKMARVLYWIARDKAD